MGTRAILGRSARTAVLVVVAVACVAGAVGAAATRHGSGLALDSYGYLGAASNLVHEHSLTLPFDEELLPYAPTRAAEFDGKVPLTQWPPVYPILLAAGSESGLSGQQAARVLNVFALMCTAALVALLLLWIVGRLWLAALVGVAVAVAPAMVMGHTVILTEPLFIVFELLALGLVLRYLERPRPLTLAGLAGLVALTVFTRYVGVALVVPLVFLLVRSRDGRGRRRIREAALIVAAGVVPVGVWSAVTRAQGGTAVRQIRLHSGAAYGNQARYAIRVVTGWFLPFGVGWVGGLVLLAGFFAGLVLVARSVSRGESSLASVERTARASAAIWFAVVLAAGTVAILLLTELFLDRYVTLESRYLFPLLAPLAVGAVTAVCVFGERSGRVTASAAVVVVVAVFMAWPTHVADAVRDPSPVYARSAPRAQLYDVVRSLPRGTLVITNEPGSMWFATGCRCILVPDRVSLTTGVVNPDFERELRETGDLMRRRHAVLAIVPNLLAGKRLATLDDLRRSLPLVRYASVRGGTIWRIAPGS